MNQPSTRIPTCHHHRRSDAFRRGAVAVATFALLAVLAAFTSYGSSTPRAKADDSVEESRAAAFRSVEGASVEQVPGGALMVGAYGVCWCLLLFYLLRIHALDRGTRARLDELGLQLDKSHSEGEELASGNQATASPVSEK